MLFLSTAFKNAFSNYMHPNTRVGYGFTQKNKFPFFVCICTFSAPFKVHICTFKGAKGHFGVQTCILGFKFAPLSIRVQDCTQKGSAIVAFRVQNCTFFLSVCPYKLLHSHTQEEDH